MRFVQMLKFQVENDPKKLKCGLEHTHTPADEFEDQVGMMFGRSC